MTTKTENKQVMEPTEQTSTPRSDENKAPKDGKQQYNKKTQEYFKAELNRVDVQLKKEAEKIQKPPEREFFPNVFNDLEPYIDLKTPRYVIEILSEDVPPGGAGYKTRATAQGMTEPWVDLKMDADKDFALQQKEAAQQAAAANAQQPTKRDASPDRKAPPKIRRDRTEILQGTILPRYPIVHVANPEMASRELTFDDVSSIRNEVRTKYMACSQQKIDSDYRYTKEDFTKLELDRLAEVRLRSQPSLRLAYFAYLQNTPGSKKAIRDCMRQFDKEHTVVQLGKVKEEEASEATKQPQEPTATATVVQTNNKKNKKEDDEKQKKAAKTKHEATTPAGKTGSNSGKADSSKKSKQQQQQPAPETSEPAPQSEKQPAAEPTTTTTATTEETQQQPEQQPDQQSASNNEEQQS